jgi:hypothetical protein
MKKEEKSCPPHKYFNINKPITVLILKSAIEKMEDGKVEYFKIGGYNYSSTCSEKRPETQAEIDMRIKKEQEKKIAQYKKIEKEKKALIARAEKLGLTLVESN